MLYNVRKNLFTPDLDFNLEKDLWDQLKLGDYSISAPVGKVIEQISYSRALNDGAIEAVLHSLRRDPAITISRSLPFWGFWEYIVSCELQLGIHVQNGILIRYDVIDLWMDNPKLWLEYLTTPHTQNKLCYGFESDTPFPINLDTIGWSYNPNNPNQPHNLSVRNKYRQLFKKCDYNVVKLLSHPDTK